MVWRQPAASGLHWMKGATDSFELVADATITGIWSNDSLYSMDFIDDLLNAAKFTIRITPKAVTVATPNPTYVGQSWVIHMVHQMPLSV